MEFQKALLEWIRFNSHGDIFLVRLPINLSNKIGHIELGMS